MSTKLTEDDVEKYLYDIDLSYIKMFSDFNSLSAASNCRAIRQPASKLGGPKSAAMQQHWSADRPFTCRKSIQFNAGIFDFFSKSCNLFQIVFFITNSLISLASSKYRKASSFVGSFSISSYLTLIPISFKLEVDAIINIEKPESISAHFLNSAEISCFVFIFSL